MKHCIAQARELSVALVALLFAVSPPVFAQDAPAEVKPQTAEQLNQQAYELSKAAATEDEVNKVIEICQQSLGGQASPAEKKYANSLLSWSYNKRGEVRAEMGQESEAMADFEESLKLDPNRWMALHNRGVSHGIAGNLDAALADFNRVVQLNQSFPKAYYNRGELKFKRGDLPGAIADYSSAVRLNPRDAGALTSRGFAYYSRGDYRNALRDYNQALQIDANSAEAYTLRGDAEADQAQFAQAVQDYQAAVRVNPQYGRVYQSSAWLRSTCPNAQFRNTEVALRNAQKAIDLDGEGDYRYLETLAAAQANAGQFDDAKATQTRALEAAKTANLTQAAANRMQERLKLYESGQPYRDVRPGAPQPRS